MEIEVLDYRLYMAVHVDVFEYSERVITSLVYPCKKTWCKTTAEEKFQQCTKMKCDST
jgi:hypothetical protein